MEGSSKVRLPSLLVWLGLIPPRVEVLCWLVVSGKVSTANNLRWRGLLLDGSSGIRVLCEREMEVIYHLFVHRAYVRFIWRRFLEKSEASWCMTSSMVPCLKPGG